MPKYKIGDVVLTIYETFSCMIPIHAKIVSRRRLGWFGFYYICTERIHARDSGGGFEFQTIVVYESDIECIVEEDKSPN